MKSDNSKNQMRWVILLLAVAVILPTVCLLFFMTQAVKNERLAMRQRMVDFYTKKINEVFPLPAESLELVRLDSTVSSRLEPIDLRKVELTDANINRLVFPEPSEAFGGNFDSFVIYDSNDVMVHPVLEEFGTLPAGFDEAAAKAYQFEFQDVNIPAAISEYEKIAKESKDERVKFAAEIAKVRCFKKIDKKKEAIELAKKMSYLETETIPNKLAGDILRARVMLSGLLEKDDLRKHQSMIHELIYKTASPQTHFPSEIRSWALTSLVKHKFKSPLFVDAAILEIMKLEDTAVSAADIFPNTRAFKDWPDRTYRQIQSDPVQYGVHFGAGGNHFLKVLNEDKIANMLESRASIIADNMVFFRIYDDKGQMIAGEPRLFRGKEVKFGWQFLEIVPGENFPGWKVEFYFRSSTYSNAAKRQKIIYVWTGVLLVCLILIISGLAGKSILRQAKLNTLKNDFIATVTHELKTPLASMRVLVDTLLEGSYSDQKQAVEYLQLISKENKRLTGLIDNFLTFSRMERNKQAFEMFDCPAADIVNDAAAAVRTKFDQKNCRFSVTIGEDVESVYADKDAMVTVLINLLDNAYKYSGDDKEIELSVYNDNGSVCFAVKDNGIGMSPRVQKKVFERFYQADSKLSRAAEGCGLGLSIVRFIVDAHGGSIGIDSESGKGTVVTVKLL